MDTCQARRGFLLLHDCGNPATYTCETCNRTMCTEHMSSRSGYKSCLECQAKAYQHQPDVPRDYDSDWVYGYRRHYYTTYGYQPFYDGALVYDDYDVRSFDDHVNAGAADRDDAERAGFGDS